MRVQTPSDINYLRQLLASGQITEQDLSGQGMSGSFGPPQQNALAQMITPQEQPQSEPPQNFVRNEDTGHTTYLTPQGLSDTPPQAMQQPQQQAPQQRQMRVVGAGNGSTVDLSPEPARAVPIDYTRAPVDVPGVGKAYYAKDGSGAYVMGPNGPQTKVILGYDAAGSRALNKDELARRQGEQQIAQSQASVAHTQEQIRASKVNNPDMLGGGAAPTGPAAMPVTGEDALKGIDPGTAGLVKALASGRMAFPGGMAMRSPRMLQLLNLVSSYDPTFDATDYQARNKTLSGFTAGKQGDAVKAVNQAIAHAGSLSDTIDKLDNFNGIFTPLNKVVNPIQDAFGDPRQGNFKMNALALSAELRKVFSGTGGGGLTELQSWESGLPLNASKEQQKAYLAKGIELLHGGIGALNDQFVRGMGPRANVMDIISPKAKATLEKLSGGGQAEQSGSLTVTAPDGSVHRFPTLAAANQFKQAIGQ